MTAKWGGRASDNRQHRVSCDTSTVSLGSMRVHIILAVLSCHSSPVAGMDGACAVCRLADVGSLGPFRSSHSGRFPARIGRETPFDRHTKLELALDMEREHVDGCDTRECI